MPVYTIYYYYRQPLYTTILEHKSFYLSTFPAEAHLRSSAPSFLPSAISVGSGYVRSRSFASIEKYYFFRRYSSLSSTAKNAVLKEGGRRVRARFVLAFRVQNFPSLFSLSLPHSAPHKGDLEMPHCVLPLEQSLRTLCPEYTIATRS